MSKKQNNPKYVYGSIDAEYVEPYIQEEITHDGKKEAPIFYKKAIMGYVNHKGIYTYKDALNTQSMKALIKQIIDDCPDGFTYIIYTYYSKAEAQFIMQHLVDVIFPSGSYQIVTKSILHKITKKEQGKELYYLPADFKVDKFRLNLDKAQKYVRVIELNTPVIFVKTGNKQIVFKDLQRITGSASLEKLITSLNLPTSEHWNNMKKRRAAFDDIDDEIIRYNEEDCRLTLKAAEVFHDYMRKIFMMSGLQLRLEQGDVMTLGMYIVDFLEQADTKRLLALESDIVKDRKKRETIVWYDDAFESYRGGGLNHVSSQDIIHMLDCYYADVASLYPRSTLLMLEQFYESEADVKMADDLDDIPEDHYYIAICKLRDTFYPMPITYEVFNNTTNEVEEAEGQVFCKATNTLDEPSVYVHISKSELEVLKKYYPQMKIKVDKIMHWKPKPYTELIEKLKFLISTRLKFKHSDKEDEKAMNEILKIFINALYGKMGQKISTNTVSNKLGASLITAFSRYIMLRLFFELRERGIDVVHMATDSIMCQNWLKDGESLPILEEIKQKQPELGEVLEVEKCLEILILKHKVYFKRYMKKDKNTGELKEVIDFKHHGIHLPKSVVKDGAKELFEAYKQVLPLLKKAYKSFLNPSNGGGYYAFYPYYREEQQTLGDLMPKQYKVAGLKYKKVENPETEGLIQVIYKFGMKDILTTQLYKPKLSAYLQIAYPSQKKAEGYESIKQAVDDIQAAKRKICRLKNQIIAQLAGKPKKRNTFMLLQPIYDVIMKYSPPVIANYAEELGRPNELTQYIDNIKQIKISELWQKISKPAFLMQATMLMLTPVKGGELHGK